MAVARETVAAPEGRCGYVDSRLRELGVEPRRQVTQRTLMGRAGRGRDDALIRTGTLCWRAADLELLEQLVAERRNVLEAWRRAVTGIGVLVAVAPEQGDCLGRLALLEEAQPDGFTRAEVLRIYRQARPVIVRTVYPGVIEECGDLAPVPPWMEQ